MELSRRGFFKSMGAVGGAAASGVSLDVIGQAAAKAKAPAKAGAMTSRLRACPQ